jgi:endonuclease III
MKNYDFEAVNSILKEHFQENKLPIIDLMAVSQSSPYRMLVATILSTRTKDETTAKAAKRLFEIADNFDDLQKLSVEIIAKAIFPVGFYKEKAKHLSQIPDIINQKFGGEIPQTIDELLQLPGVGRKVANLLVAAAFNKPAICVDTHVHRIFNRIGFVKTKNPTQTETALRKILPQNYWISINGYMVSYGQNICLPISPKCSICKIADFCEKNGVVKSR